MGSPTPTLRWLPPSRYKHLLAVWAAMVTSALAWTGGCHDSSGQDGAEQLSFFRSEKENLQKNCEEYGESDSEYQSIKAKREKGEKIEPGEYNRNEKSCKKLHHCSWTKNGSNSDDGVCVKACDKLTPSAINAFFTGHKNSMRKCNVADGCAWDWNVKTDKWACVDEFDLGTSHLFTEEKNFSLLLLYAKLLNGGELTTVAKWDYLDQLCNYRYNQEKKCTGDCKKFFTFSSARSSGGTQCGINCGLFNSYLDLGKDVCENVNGCTRNNDRCENTNRKKTFSSDVKAKNKRMIIVNNFMKECNDIKNKKDCEKIMINPSCLSPSSQPCRREELVRKCVFNKNRKCLVNCEQFDFGICQEADKKEKFNQICQGYTKFYPCLFREESEKRKKADEIRKIVNKNQKFLEDKFREAYYEKDLTEECKSNNCDISNDDHIFILSEAMSSRYKKEKNILVRLADIFKKAFDSSKRVIKKDKYGNFPVYYFCVGNNDGCYGEHVPFSQSRDRHPDFREAMEKWKRAYAEAQLNSK